MFFLGKIAASFQREYPMAVINCPNCKKKISNKATSCSHCQIDLTDLNEEKLLSMKSASLAERQQTLMNHSFIAMLLFCGGFLFLFWDNAQPGSWQYATATASTGLGFIFYLVTRVRILLLKKSSN